jgi:hypothetical protein
MGIADLPDIDEDEWHNYQADIFRRQAQPLSDSAAFMASTVPFLARIEQAQAIMPEPVAPPPAPAMNLGAPTSFDPLSSGGTDGMGGMDGMSRQPLFGQDSTTSSLFDELTSFDGDEDQPAYKSDGFGPPAGTPPTPGPWAGTAPDKPNAFSWAGTQLGNLADAAKGNDFLTSGQGKFARGAVRGLSDVAHRLGGSAEALRQGDVLGGVGGAAGAVFSPGDVLRGAAREMEVPEQILPQIQPDTPVLGGLNNPRELAGLVPELLIPATAVERAIGKGVGALARPVGRAIGEVTSPLVDRALSAGRRLADTPLGLVTSEARDTFHGSPARFDRPDVGKFDPQGLDGPAYYTSADRTVSEGYAGTGADANIRRLRVAPGVRLLDMDDFVPDDELAMIRRGLPDEVARLIGGDPALVAREFDDTLAQMPGPRQYGEAPSGQDLYNALSVVVGQLTGKGMDKGAANRLLASLGYDGTTRYGGAMMGDRTHEVTAIFPESLEKVTNLDTGLPGGITARAMESPFFSPARTAGQAASDIAMGTAGGVAGAATADEDATWQERAGRFAAGAALGAGLGPMGRSEAGIGGVFRKLSENQVGELGIAGGGGKRRLRQGIPDFGDVQPPIPPEQWETMTPRQRRSARDAAEAGRPYTPQPRTGTPAQQIAQEVEEELPDLAPSTDPLPPAERSADALTRIINEMSSGAKEKVLQQASGQTMQRQAPYMKGLVERTLEGVDETTPRYDEILKITNGQESVGRLVAEAADEAEAGIRQPIRWTKRMGERLGNPKALDEMAAPLRKQLLAERDQMVKELMVSHGYKNTAMANQDAQTIIEFIGQFAKNARPNEPVNQAMLTAGREARAAAQWPKFIAIDEYEKALADPNASAETKAVLKQAMDYWDTLSRVLSLYSGETASSEVARTFRSMRDKPAGVRVGGGTFQPGEKLPSGEVVPGKNKGVLSPEEKAYQDRLAQQRKDLELREDSTPASRLQRQRSRLHGKRPNGPMEDLGLEWDDIFARDPDDTAQRAKMMAGLEDMGGYRFRRDWTPRLRALDLDDADAVKQFWTDARDTAGLDENMMPLVDFNPQIEGQSYLGGADAITKKDALNLVNKTLIKDAANAYRAVRKARLEKAPRDELQRLQEEATAAYHRVGIDISEWPENGIPIIEKVVDSLGAKIAKEWPEDRVAKAGEAGGVEMVEKKRQLLGLFDQAIKKEQKLAGIPVTGIQDFLSFGSSNVLATPRYLQAATLESAWNMINEPLEQVLRGNYGGAKQQVLGILRAFNLPTSDDLLKLGEGIKAPAMVNALRGLKDVGPMQATGELRDIATRQGHIMSDSPNKLGRLLSPMHRFSRGLSEAFQTGSYFGEVARLAKDASEQGVLPGGKKLIKVLDENGEFRYPSMAELYGNLPQEIVDAALKRSKTISEGGEADILEKQFGQWKGLLNKPGATTAERTMGVFANLMFPFVYGLRPAIQGGARTIAGPVRYPIKAATALARGDKGEAAYMMKKAGLASAFDGYIAYQVMSGNITGHGPSDAGARQAMMEATDENGDPVWRPDSIRLPSPDGGHFWVKYTSMPGPVSMVAGIMANGYESYMYDGKPMEDYAQTAQRIAPQLAAAAVDSTYFRDFIDLATAMNSTGGDNTLQRLGGQIAGRFVPAAGALRLGAQLSDPTQRATEGALQDIQSGIPGLRQQLPALKSPYTGENQELPLNPLTALGGLSGNVYASPEREAPVAREVMEASRRRLPWEGGQRPADVADVRVTPRTFTRGEQTRGTEFQGLQQTGAGIRGAQAAYGAETQENLLPLITSPQYMALPPEGKARMLAQAMKASTAEGEWAAQGAPGVQLQPDAQVKHALMGQPMFRGQEEGSPTENAAMNQQIITAQNALAQLTQRYGRRAAIIMLDEQAPEMLELALLYKKYNPDVRWLMEQETRQSMGIPEAPYGDLYVPDYGGGAGTAVGAPTDAITGRSLPPGLREILSGR